MQHCVVMGEKFLDCGIDKRCHIQSILKYTGKKFCLDRVSNSQPPGHEPDTLTTDKEIKK